VYGVTPLLIYTCAVPLSTPQEVGVEIMESTTSAVGSVRVMEITVETVEQAFVSRTVTL